MQKTEDVDNCISFGFVAALNAHCHYSASSNTAESTAAVRLRAAVLSSLKQTMDTLAGHLTSDPDCAQGEPGTTQTSQVNTGLYARVIDTLTTDNEALLKQVLAYKSQPDQLVSGLVSGRQLTTNADVEEYLADALKSVANDQAAASG